MRLLNPKLPNITLNPLSKINELSKIESAAVNILYGSKVESPMTSTSQISIIKNHSRRHSATAKKTGLIPYRLADYKNKDDIVAYAYNYSSIAEKTDMNMQSTPIEMNNQAIGFLKAVTLESTGVEDSSKDPFGPLNEKCPRDSCTAPVKWFCISEKNGKVVKVKMCTNNSLCTYRPGDGEDEIKEYFEEPSVTLPNLLEITDGTTVGEASTFSNLDMELQSGNVPSTLSAEDQLKEDLAFIQRVCIDERVNYFELWDLGWPYKPRNDIELKTFNIIYGK